MKRHYAHCISYNVKHLIEGGLQFRCLVNYHGGKLGSRQGGMVLERKLIVIYLDQQAGGRESHIS